MPETAYDARTYFTENEADDVKGFAVLARHTSGGRTEYHVAEKWIGGGPNGDDVWIDYYVPHNELTDRLDADECAKAGTLSDEQYAAVCENVGWDYDSDEASQEAAAAA